jgi:hypothetical protein
MRRLLFGFHLGDATSTDFVDWAVEELVASRDTPNLRILAGLPKPPYWAEVEYYFRRTLEDLGWEMPERVTYLRQYARETAADILSGAIPALDGRDEIWRVSHALGYPTSLRSWIYLDECMDPVTLCELEKEELEAAIRSEAELLLQVADAP